MTSFTPTSPDAATNDNDLILGTGLPEKIDALDGDDLVLAGGGNDTVRGGEGEDILLGEDGDDELVGDRGNDAMFGGDGDDRMIWNNGDGSDVMEGGEGFDTAEANGSDTLGDVFEIEAGEDGRVDFARTNFGPFTLDIGTTERLVVDGKGGDDVIKAGEGLAGLIDLKLYGGDGNDTIQGGDGDDYLFGGKGNDFLEGEKGNDVMKGGAGRDTMEWDNGDGSDIMEGGKGFDTAIVEGAETAGDHFLVETNGDRVAFERVNLGPFTLDIGTTEKMEVEGLGGDDVIDARGLTAGLIKLVADGGEGNDDIFGSEGDDRLSGGDGHDELVGFRGNDVMKGGAGRDRLIWNNGDGSDVMDGGKGSDTVEANGSDTADDVFEIDGDGKDIDFARTNFGQFTLDISKTEVIEVNGLGGDDVIIASDNLWSRATLRLDGGAGNDTITGGNTDDRIEGGAGDDLLTGGTGADVFVFNLGDDRITDFEQGVDEVQLVGLPGIDSFDDIEGLLQQAGTDVVLGFGDRSLTFENQDIADFSANDFDFL